MRSSLEFRSLKKDENTKRVHQVLSADRVGNSDCARLCCGWWVQQRQRILDMARNVCDNRFGVVVLTDAATMKRST